MLKYIVTDIQNVLKFYPLGIGTGVVLFLFLAFRKRYLEKNGKETKRILPSCFFFGYYMIILTITLFSREAGGGKRIDLELFSTLRINTRNTAYVIENILFFIPFGIFGRWADLSMDSCIRKILRILFWGFLTSLEIEVLQLLTGRGCFQVDDIWTNTLGALLGALLGSIYVKKNDL